MEPFNEIEIDKQTEMILSQFAKKKNISSQDFLRPPGASPESFRKFLDNEGLSNDSIASGILTSLLIEQDNNLSQKHKELLPVFAISKHIRYLKMVKDHKGTIGAADAENITPRQISFHLKKLEEIVGGPVISRKQFQKSQINELGEILLNLYSQINQEIHDPFSRDSLKKLRLPGKTKSDSSSD